MIFVSGDDAESKRVVKDLIESFGFAAIDLGGLVTGGRIQQAGGPLADLDLLSRPDTERTPNDLISEAIDPLADKYRRP